MSLQRPVMIKAVALFGPKPGWSDDEFLAHYLERHAALCAGTASFTRNCVRYVQNVPALDAGSFPVTDQGGRRLAVSEMWFRDATDMTTTYSADDYLARLRPDEMRFADFETASVWLCEEREVWAAPATRKRDPDKAWAHASRITLFVFRSARAVHDVTAASGAWTASIPSILEAIPAFADGATRYRICQIRPEEVADLPSSAGDRTALIEQFDFATVAAAINFWLAYGVDERVLGLAREWTDTSAQRTFLARNHAVFE